jgi:predicted acyltransferase
MANGNASQASSKISDLIFEPTSQGGWQLKWDFYQALAIIVGVIMLGIYAWRSQGWLTFATCVLVAAAALAAGLLLGFLFGIPKTDQPNPAGGQTQTTPKKLTLKANTNLVEISDWLTKMIVGVGLSQLSTLPGKLKSLAGYFATAFGPPAAPGSLVLAILGYFGIFGFLLGYLWARIYLTKEFEQDGSDDAAQQGAG